jgi:protein SCO1/2
MHIPEEGEEVPDFHLVNQDGKKISFDRYRTKVLLITFIYTRCPFPDFCPRITQKFAEVNRQLDADKALGPQTHLISISFDPEHDTPKVLRAYGIQALGGEPATKFVHWEFATASPKDLPKLADFFGLTIQPDSGLITHSLSTAVIGPDGKISKWYHGSDWEPATLVQDAANALHTST